MHTQIHVVKVNDLVTFTVVLIIQMTFEQGQWPCDLDLILEIIIFNYVAILVQTHDLVLWWI